MSDILALEKLFKDVAARLQAEAPSVVVVFGWREPSRQLNQGVGGGNRIVFTPGAPTGDLGKVVGPDKPGRNPRPLATLQEAFTVLIWGYDSSLPEDELAQYKATRLLYDTWFRACVLSFHARFHIISQAWSTERKERQLGAVIQAVCTVDAMIPDVASVEVLPGQITVREKAVFPAGDFDEGSDTITAGGP